MTEEYIHSSLSAKYIAIADHSLLQICLTRGINSDFCMHAITQGPDHSKHLGGTPQHFSTCHNASRRRSNYLNQLCCLQVYKESKQGIIMLSRLLHQLPSHKHHIATSSSLLKSTLGFRKNLFSYHLQPLLRDPGKVVS